MAVGKSRFTLVYIGLVGVPVVAAIALLGANIGDRGDATAASVDGGHSTARLFLAVAAVVGACKLAGAAMRRLGQPPVVGEIAAGIVLGPSVFGALWPAARGWLIPGQVLPQLNTLAQLGVVLFIFLTGLELNLRLLKGCGQLAVMVSHVSIAAPFLLGVLLALAAYDRFAPDAVGYLPFALFLGLAMSVTALPVLARILTDLRMSRTRIGVLVMTCALVDDVTAWILLAVVIAVISASSALGVLSTIALTAAFVGLLFALRPLLARALETTEPRRIRITIPLVLVGVLLSATATEWIGVHAIFGAFVFGLVLPGDSAVAQRIHQMVGSLTATLLLPLFFAYIGLQTELTLLGGNAALWLWCGLIIVVSALGKFGGSALAARAIGADWHQAGQIGALMNCRGLTELVVLKVGLDLGVLSRELFAMLVVMALLSTALAGPAVTWFAALARRAAAPPEHADVARYARPPVQKGHTSRWNVRGSWPRLRPAERPR